MSAKYFIHFSLALISLASTALAAGLGEQARDFKAQLETKVLPYWFDTGIDAQYGGYLLSDDGSGRKTKASEKQLVSQARMIWTFSLVHRKGYSTPKRDYLKAAAQGYQFLLAHFLDRENGGYYWKTDLAGKVTDDRKLMYGQSFVMYALAEYYRASGDKEALKYALDLYGVIQKKAYDPEHTGWTEHFYRDWKPLPKGDPNAQVEVAGYKSANTHLHLMEALTELYEVSRDPAVRKSLEEAVKINSTWFYPADASASCFHRQPDWSAVTDPKSAGLSYGHNVEFAWLLVRAEEVLGKAPSWSHFDAHLRHCLKYGWDGERGGVYSRGNGNSPANQTEKTWWVQAEMLAALTDGLKHNPDDAAFKAVLGKLLTFIQKYQADPVDGIWYDTVNADGTPRNKAKAHSWKANYHDVRAIVKFIDAFGN